jgi:hypothetical protein
MEEVITSRGSLPRWKARALALGEIQAVINEAATQIRADSAKDDQPQLDIAPPEQQPPPLVADAAETTAQAPSIDAEHLASIDAAIDALTARVDRMEAAQRAEAALEALEAAEDVAEAANSPQGMMLQ